MKKKKVVIEMLMEGTGGDLIFKPVEFETKTALKKAVEKETNTMLKHNLKKAAKETKEKI